MRPTRPRVLNFGAGAGAKSPVVASMRHRLATTFQMLGIRGDYYQGHSEHCQTHRENRQRLAIHSIFHS